MDSSRKQRFKQLQALFEPGFRRMLAISFLLHLLLPLSYNLSFFSKQQLKPPVYRVNLVNKIVEKPQAGRPEATKIKKPKPKKKPKAKPKPIPPKPAAVKPKPVPVKPKPKVAPKPAPQPTVSKAQENSLQQRLKQLRAKQDEKQAEAERQKRLDALRAAATAESQQIESPIDDAPVGMPDGKGDEAGVSAIAHVQEFIRQQWTLSQYQVSGDPEAEVILIYNAEGRRIHYRFIKKSGNRNFDESLTKAINKSKQLNRPLPKQMEFHIVFNLKEMSGRR